MKRTTVTLTDELVETLEREAYRRRTSVSQVVRDALQRSFASSSAQLPWQGLVNDGRHPARNMDSELAGSWGHKIAGRRR